MTSTDNRKKTKQTVLLALIVVAIAAVVVAAVLKNRKVEHKIIEIGDRAPAFRLPLLNGKQAGTADFRGKVVMVHFWATWCPPCVEEIPTLAALYQSLIGKDFEMLAVSVDEGGAAAVSSFLQQKGLAVPVLLDPDHAIASSYGTFKFPETYILDRQGIVRGKVIGARDWRDPEALRAITALIDAKE